ncbi:MAG: hypothetical protein WAW63_01000 [Candidatus Saccharimonadales bacterium]
MSGRGEGLARQEDILEGKPPVERVAEVISDRRWRMGVPKIQAFAGERAAAVMTFGLVTAAIEDMGIVVDLNELATRIEAMNNTGGEWNG